MREVRAVRGLSVAGLLPAVPGMEKSQEEKTQKRNREIVSLVEDDRDVLDLSRITVIFKGRNMKEWAVSFYKSQAWKSIRQTAITRDAYLCQDCLAKGRYTPAEEVHHITELTPQNITDPEISLNLSNLVSLCRECHRARHEKREPRRFSVDEFGHVKIF